MKVLCIGHAAYDTTILLDSFPVENTKNRIENRIECGGGPASTAAYLLGKWNIDTYFMGIVGNDIYGKRIKEEFDKVNVNTKYMEVNNEHVTTSSFIIANTSIGSRTIFTYRPNTLKMSDVDIDFEPDYILIDGQEYELSKKMLEKYPNAISVIDAGRCKDDIIELAKMVNYLVCSKDFAEKITELKIDYSDFETLRRVYEKLETIFTNNIVVTLEQHGCLYRDGDVKIMPSIKVKPLDSTGAGDIYHGAFVYGLIQKFEFEKVLKFANIAGAISVTRAGGRNSIPELEEMEKVYNESR